MTEDELLTGVCDALAAGGWLYFHVRRSDVGIVQGNVGFPDLACVHAERGLALFLELKAAAGRVAEWQQRWLDAMRAAGLDARVVRPTDYPALVNEIVGDRLLKKLTR